MAEQDRHIDVRLRDVTVPADLDRRLAADAVFGDDSLDRLLADVELPAGFVERMRANFGRPRQTGRGAGAIDLDGFATSASTAGEPTDRRRSRVGRWATVLVHDGLAVAAALSMAWLVFAAGAELSRQLAAAPRDRLSEAARGIAPPRATVTNEPPVAGRRSNGGESAGLVRRPPPRVAPATEAASATARDVAGESTVAASGVGPATPSVAEPAALPPEVRAAAVGLAAEQPDDSSVRRLLEPPRDAWRRVPRVRGFDLAFEMAHGEPPFVDPAAAGLSTDVPPLTLRTDTFDRLSLPDGRSWHGADRNLRMEHVLAAIPAAAAEPRPGPAGRSGIRVDVHGVRSLRSVRGAPSLLVEVAATASRGGRADSRPPLDATIVLDRSPGRDPAIWPWLCRGLAAVAAEMGADDRITVVLSGPVPRLAARRGDAGTIASLAVELEQLPPMDASDLDAAIRMAASEATDSVDRLVVVAHQETADRGRDVVRAALAGWREAQASAGGGPLHDVPSHRGLTRFVLVDPTTSPGEHPQGSSFGRTPADATAIRREFVREVFGSDTLVGRQCRLAVSFDPRLVAAYRLIGHRQSAMESLAVAAPAAIDLHVGETVRAVYEIVPRGGASAAGVSAVLEWRDANDVENKSRGILSTADPDRTAALPSPRSLELILAVTFAEAVGGSAHGDPRAIATAAALVRRWRERGDITSFGEVLAAGIERFPAGRRPRR